MARTQRVAGDRLTELEIEQWLRSVPADKEELRSEEFDTHMAQRVRRGAAAIHVGSGNERDSGEPAETNLVDTLANLLHWVDCYNANRPKGEAAVDFEDALRQATNHHEEERAGEL